MQIATEKPTTTEAVVTVSLRESEMLPIKQHVLGDLAKNLKLPGFRPGKIPADMVQKQVDQNLLQSEFLEHAINHYYPEAIQQAGLRPVAQPAIDIKKFVPFSTLEFIARMPVIGTIKLGDYTKIRKARPIVKISQKDIDEVIESLRQRAAQKQPVDRAAKDGDEIIIDFKGTDANGKPVKGADGQDYPLGLGSNTFIPGFEDNLIGMKADDQKNFELTFPKDYSLKALAGRKVKFEVTAKAVNELKLPELDDEFAASAGPVKDLKQLREDIEKELAIERQRQSDLDYESELVKELSAISKIDLPKQMVDEEVDRMMRDLQQNLIYRGQTIQEFLESEKTTEEKYRKDVLRPQAQDRVKAGVALAEVADQESLTVTPGELDVRIKSLKAQYSDPQTQAELDKPENRRDIASRMLSEKTVAILASYAQKK